MNPSAGRESSPCIKRLSTLARRHTDVQSHQKRPNSVPQWGRDPCPRENVEQGSTARQRVRPNPEAGIRPTRGGPRPRGSRARTGARARRRGSQTCQHVCAVARRRAECRACAVSRPSGFIRIARWCLLVDSVSGGHVPEEKSQKSRDELDRSPAGLLQLADIRVSSLLVSSAFACHIDLWTMGGCASVGFGESNPTV